MAREIHYTAFIVSIRTRTLATLIVMATLLGLGTPRCEQSQTS